MDAGKTRIRVRGAQHGVDSRNLDDETNFLPRGGDLGDDWQMSNVVLGVEAQGNWADLSGSNVSLAFPATAIRTKVNSFGLFTGQLGYAWDRALLYVKGGAAVTDNRFSVLPAAGGFAFDSVSESRWVGT